MKFLDDITYRLDKLDWSVFEKTHQQVEEILEEVNLEKSKFGDNILNSANLQINDLIQLSRERTTHFKWFLYKNVVKGYRIWLHQYKVKSERREGYAEVPHNHLYWFSSLILTGGFKHCIYDVREKNSNESTVERIDLIKKDEFAIGKIYSLNKESVHSLEEIIDPTITLVIQSPDMRNYSESFDIKNKTKQKHFTLESKLEKFRRELKSI